MRFPAHTLLVLTLAAGCEQSVELASECPEGLRCVRERVEPPDAGQGLVIADDAASGAPEDAGFIALRDAAPASWFASAEYPAIRNPSFELGPGAGGDLAFINLSFDPAESDVPHWRACQLFTINIPTPTDFPTNFTAIAIRRALATDAGTILPDDPDTFLTVSFPPFFPAEIGAIPMSQQLATPLRAGVRYAFAVSVYRVDTSVRYSLRVFGSNTDCFVEDTESPLAEVEVPSEAGWHDLCVAFTPDHDVEYFMLAAGIVNRVLNISFEEKIGFALDNLREPSSCAPQ